MMDSDGYSAFLQHPDDHQQDDDESVTSSIDDSQTELTAGNKQNHRQLLAEAIESGTSRPESTSPPQGSTHHPSSLHQQSLPHQQTQPQRDSFGQPSSFIPFSIPHPYLHNPYFLTPVHHNPYSPTGGQGLLHPPTISQNLRHVLAYETQDIDQYLNQDDSSPDPPPAKRRKQQISSVEDTSRPVEELFTEINEPMGSPVDDNDSSSESAPLSNKSPKPNIARFKCSVCDAKFPRKNAIVAHIKTHLGKKKYICGHQGCNMAFVREHDCKRHEATHTGSRPHVCVCGRPFARPDALRRHRDRGHCGNDGDLSSSSSAPKPAGRWKGGGRPSNIARAAAAMNPSSKSAAGKKNSGRGSGSSDPPNKANRSPSLVQNDSDDDNDTENEDVGSPAGSSTLSAEQLALLSNFQQQFNQGTLRGSPDWASAIRSVPPENPPGSGGASPGVPPMNELVTGTIPPPHVYELHPGRDPSPIQSPLNVINGRSDRFIRTADGTSNARGQTPSESQENARAGSVGVPTGSRKGKATITGSTSLTAGNGVAVSQYFMPFASPNLGVHEAAANFLASLHPSLLPQLPLPASSSSSHSLTPSANTPQTPGSLPVLAPNGPSTLDPSVPNLVAMALETVTRQAQAQAHARAVQDAAAAAAFRQSSPSDPDADGMVDGMEMDLSKYTVPNPTSSDDITNAEKTSQPTDGVLDIQEESDSSNSPIISAITASTRAKSKKLPADSSS